MIFLIAGKVRRKTTGLREIRDDICLTAADVVVTLTHGEMEKTVNSHVLCVFLQVKRKLASCFPKAFFFSN